MRTITYHSVIAFFFNPHALLHIHANVHEGHHVVEGTVNMSRSTGSSDGTISEDDLFKSFIPLAHIQGVKSPVLSISLR